MGECTVELPLREIHAPGARRASGPEEGDILPHERTLPKAKSDRLALLRATRANLDPIWGLSLADGLTAAIGELDPGTTMSAVDPTGARHEIA